MSFWSTLYIIQLINDEDVLNDHYNEEIHTCTSITDSIFYYFSNKLPWKWEIYFCCIKMLMQRPYKQPDIRNWNIFSQSETLYYFMINNSAYFNNCEMLRKMRVPFKSSSKKLPCVPLISISGGNRLLIKIHCF